LQAADVRAGTSSGPKAAATIDNGLAKGMRAPRFPDRSMDLEFQSVAVPADIKKIIAQLPPAPSSCHDAVAAKHDAVVAKAEEPEAPTIETALEVSTEIVLDDATDEEEEDYELATSNLFRARIAHGYYLNETELIAANRCLLCHDCDRPCQKCAIEKLRPGRQYPRMKACPNPVILALKNKKTLVHKAHVHRCGLNSCPVCGFDLECDHLTHWHLIFRDVKGRETVDLSPGHSVTIYEPLYSITDSRVCPIQVKDAVFRFEVTAEHRTRVVKRLSKNHIPFICDYVDSHKRLYVFYCFLPHNMDPSILRCKQKCSGLVLAPSPISFAQFETEHRYYLSRMGIEVTLSEIVEEEMTDEYEGGSRRAVKRAVSYSKYLRMPKRTESSGDNEFLGLVKNLDVLKHGCAEHGVKMIDLDRRYIDKSHVRGLTSMLLRRCQLLLPVDMTEEQYEAFLKRITGKDRQLEWALEDLDLDQFHSRKRRKRATSGNGCLTAVLTI
jgi:hypothetical protein